MNNGLDDGAYSGSFCKRPQKAAGLQKLLVYQFDGEFSHGMSDSQ